MLLLGTCFVISSPGEFTAVVVLVLVVVVVILLFRFCAGSEEDDDEDVAGKAKEKDVQRRKVKESRIGKHFGSNGFATNILFNKIASSSY